MRILLDNALRHTPEGTDVTVSANRYNGAAELTVADSGPASRPARAPRCSSASTPATPRTGGLAIARELAERMDGRLVLSPQALQTAIPLKRDSSKSVTILSIFDGGPSLLEDEGEGGRARGS